jgi:hypothetical protein
VVLSSMFALLPVNMDARDRADLLH